MNHSQSDTQNPSQAEHLAPGKPYEGILVIAIEQAVAAPLCTGRLAEMGARVIKIERPEGDFARAYDQAANGESSYFVWTNRGKESVVLDFKKQEDAQLLEKLLSKADVFIQNLAPGALAKVGLDSASLRARHPKLVTCDISGYGLAGEVSQLKAYDLLVQCESGLASITGSPAASGRVGVSVCDIGAGMNATVAILSALALRNKTGIGSGVSVSLFDGTADWMTVPYLHEVYGRGAPTRQGLQHPSIAPYGAYQTADGKVVVISIQNEREWQQFCSDFLLLPNLPQDPRFGSNTERVLNRTALDTIVAGVFAQLNLPHVIERLSRSKTAYGQVRSVAEMSKHPALRTWPMVVGDQVLQMIAPAVCAPWDSLRFPPVPKLGEHTAAVKAEFASF